jgi:SAM-dependent methyltransferase
MPMQSEICPDCGSGQTRLRGALDLRGTFAGIEVPRTPHYLHKCGHCGLAFRSPMMSQAEMLSLYAASEVEVWQQVTPPFPWTNIYQRVAKIQPTSVLDYGCFAGDFLRMLPVPCAKFGIEPSVEGGLAATSVGVQILGKTHVDLPTAARFDVITVLDVVEHVAQPSALLQYLAQHLNPGGCLILLTGAQDSIWFRLFAPSYWYCAVPEHLVFISKKWCQQFARNNKLAVIAYELIAYEPQRLPRMLVEWASAFAYRFVVPWVACFPRIASTVGLGRLQKWQVAPALRSWKDHVIVVIEKPR